MLRKLTKVVSVLVILTMLIPAAAVAMAAPPTQADQTIVDIAVADGRLS